MTKQAKDRGTGDTQYVETMLSILGYQEDGEWVALALEMDLRGYGKSWEEALSDLRELVFMQISFAVSKGQPEMIWKEAEGLFWERFRKVKRERFAQSIAKTVTESRHAGGMFIPEPHVIAAQQDHFTRANG